MKCARSGKARVYNTQTSGKKKMWERDSTKRYRVERVEDGGLRAPKAKGPRANGQKKKEEAMTRSGKVDGQSRMKMKEKQVWKENTAIS